MPKSQKKKLVKTIKQRRKAAIQKDVELLSEWEKRKAEVELCVHVPDSATLQFSGRILRLVDDWMFISGPLGSPVLRVLLFVELWHKSKIEGMDGIYRSLHIQSEAGKRSGFSIREWFNRNKEKENPAIARAENQLRTWEKLRTKLSLITARNSQAMFVPSVVVEVDPGMFSFVQISDPPRMQVIIRVLDYKFVEVAKQGTTTEIILANATGDSVKISDSTEKPDEVFRRFKDITQSIN